MIKTQNINTKNKYIILLLIKTLMETNCKQEHYMYSTNVFPRIPPMCHDDKFVNTNIFVFVF